VNKSENQPNFASALFQLLRESDRAPSSHNVGNRFFSESGLTTVICHEPSVSRASVAAAKLQDPADASLTIWWRQF
jgi:hypothetical protein